MEPDRRLLAAAKDKGVMNGEGPERPVKRDELAAVLGRLGFC